MGNSNFSVISVIRRWIRGLYDWTLRWADTPQCMAALFGFALIESSFFPIPPDVILIAIVASKPSRWLSAATLCTAGSVVGAALGYLIGLSFMATLGQPIIDWYDAQSSWEYVVNVFAGPFGIWILIAAAFTPIPFKVFTIAAGAGKKMLANLGATGSPFRASMGYRFNPDIGKAGEYQRGTVGILGRSREWESIGPQGGSWMHGKV